MSDYKLSKEAFVSGLTGSTLTHINLISSVSLTSLALYSSLSRHSTHFITQWTLLVLPLLLSITVFSDSPVYFSSAILFVSLLTRRGGEHPPHETLPSSPQPQSKSNASSTSGERYRLPALTTYRAHMMLMTVLAILAVDFPVFDRGLAKCETYGVSIMDVGVGSFVFSQGVVSSLPLIKNPALLLSPTFPKIINVTKKSIPILILGIARVLFVKSSGYPEHASEYGIHWNFFITLALLPIMQVALHPILIKLGIGYVGIGIAVLQQLLQSYAGLESYILNAPRTNLINSNKEGIVSLLGYLSIHLLGLMTGTLIIPSTPTYFKRRIKALLGKSKNKSARRDHSDEDEEDEDEKKKYTTTPFSTQRENDKTCIELLSYAIIWWYLVWICWILGVGVSRRMGNLPYILWTCAYNTTFIAGYFVVDLFWFPSPKRRTRYDESGLKLGKQREMQPLGGGGWEESTPTTTPTPTATTGTSPTLFEAINKNSLVIFLLANVTTGLVNMTTSTMYTSNSKAMGILVVYSIGVCWVAWVCRRWRIISF